MPRKLLFGLCLFAFFAQAQDPPEIMDIEPPVDVPQPYPWKMIALAGCGLASLIAAGYFIRKKPPEVVSASRVFIDAHELALKDLDSLDLTSTEIRPIFDSLELTLRGYIHGRFDLDLPHATVRELGERLQAKQTMAPDQLSAIFNLLGTCEAVRFGGYRPSRAELQGSLHGARTWIEETRLRLAVPSSTSLLFGSEATSDVAR
jgi:hypothetical protein